MQRLRRLLAWILRVPARVWLGRVRPVVIAVTGSVGKTGTKEAIGRVLGYGLARQPLQFRGRSLTRLRVSEENLNEEIGVPLSILGFGNLASRLSWFWVLPVAFVRGFFSRPVDLLVLEMATEYPGDLAFLTSIARPDIALLTSIAAAHTEFLGGLEGVAREKWTLIKALPSDGLAIFNIDNAEVRKRVRRFRGKTLTYGVRREADLRASSVSFTLEGTRFRLSYREKSALIELPTLGEPALSEALGAAAVSVALGLPLNTIAQALATLSPLPGRLEPVAGRSGSLILNDSYNANPASMVAALHLLGRNKRRRIAVLGDMEELGELSRPGHEEVGRVAAKMSDLLIAVGEKARWIARAANRMDERVKWFASKEAAVRYLAPLIRRGDVVLVKASRKHRFEEIVNALRRH